MDPLKKITDDQQVQEEPKEKEQQQVDIEQTIESLIHNLGPLDHREMMLDMYKNCSLCGNELEYVHVTHFTHLEVEEEAFCPSCNVRMKQETHKLQ
jgi:DNA-directed RNA polymerase subunit RPC12/RpoP